MSFKESPILSQLCTHLVNQQLGDIASRVFAVAARYGRQTLATIIRNAPLSSRQVKYGVIVLTQHNLLSHSTDELAFYEVNWFEAYTLVRAGKAVKFVQDRYDEKTASLISNLLSLGHTRVADLTDAYFAEKNKGGTDTGNNNLTNGTVNGNHHVNSTSADNTETEKPNGVTNGHHLANGTNGEQAVPKSDAKIESPGQLHSILVKLLNDKWLVPLNEYHFLSEGDRHIEAESFVVTGQFEGKWPKGPKQVANFTRSVNQRKRDFRDSNLNFPPPQKVNGLKRGAVDDDQPNKRQKTNGINGVNGYHASNSSYDLRLEDDLVLRVNSEKVAVTLRTEQLYNLARRRFDRCTPQVYYALLLMMEDRHDRCYEPFPDPPIPDIDGEVNHATPDQLITAREVAMKIDKNLDLTEGLDPLIIPTILNRPEDWEDDEFHPSKLTLDERARLVDKHLRLLGQDPIFYFLSWYSNRGDSQWQVEFDKLARASIQHELENTMLSRHGNYGQRIIRALQKRGRLDERLLCLTTLASPSILRPIVTQMQLEGYLQSQEIPRQEHRVAKTSMHLVFFDKQRARERLLHDTYKGMTRLLQRIRAEKEKVQPVIDKAERTDVKGHEEEYLSVAERGALREWQAVEEKLLAQLARQDDLVGILRDYMGPL